ncbi:hypothetical protein RRG08_023722 [Elysia crispata]|uniref:Uncharacterized protein n=1 Tax=Elysia crispata TaxID=231223 RepID=A0AAE1D7Q2_9GAST|nr:hypothetical protein RRG08_023722 [Elysia crispata]
METGTTAKRTAEKLGLRTHKNLDLLLASVTRAVSRESGRGHTAVTELEGEGKRKKLCESNNYFEALPIYRIPKLGSTNLMRQSSIPWILRHSPSRLSGCVEWMRINQIEGTLTNPRTMRSPTPTIKQRSSVMNNQSNPLKRRASSLSTEIAASPDKKSISCLHSSLISEDLNQDSTFSDRVLPQARPDPCSILGETARACASQTTSTTQVSIL